jgi:hypothetical protein
MTIMSKFTKDGRVVSLQQVSYGGLFQVYIGARPDVLEYDYAKAIAAFNSIV